MFDVGFWEITIIGVIALLILGPERLPRAARTAGLWVGKARRTLADVKRDIDRELDETELKKIHQIKDEIKHDLKDATDVVRETATTLNENIDVPEQAPTDKPKTTESEKTETQSPPPATEPETEPKAAT